MEEAIINPAPEPSTPDSFSPRQPLSEEKNPHNSLLLPDSPLSVADSVAEEVAMARRVGFRRVLSGNPSAWLNENTPMFPPKSAAGQKGISKGHNHLYNRENVNHTELGGADNVEDTVEKAKNSDTHVAENADNAEEFSLTGCEYDSDDFAEDISCGLKYGCKKQPTLSSSRAPSNEYSPSIIIESTHEGPAVQMSHSSHGHPLHEVTSNFVSPGNPTVKDKISRFKILGKNGFLTGWMKSNKVLNLGEENPGDEVPRDRHYEGCILCPPQPSPRASVTSTVEVQELYAPSGQNPGPPPLTPPPSPRGNKDIKGKSPMTDQAPLLAPTGFNSRRNLLGKNDQVGQPGPSSYYQGSSNGEPGPYSHYPESLNTRFSGSSSYSGDLNRYSGGFDQAENKDKKNPEPLDIRLELSSRHDQNKGDDNNLDGNIHQKSQEDNRISRFSNFSLGPCPKFVRLSGDLNECPHPGVRRDHLYLGGDGIYEMVDLDPMTEPVIVPRMPAPPVLDMSLSRPSKLSKKSFLKVLKRIGPAFAGNRKLTTLGIVVVSTLILMIILLVFVMPAVVKKSVNNASVGVAAFYINDITYNYTSITLELRITSNEKVDVGMDPGSFTLNSDNDYNYGFYHAKKHNIKSKYEVYGDDKYTEMGDLYLNRGIGFSKGNGSMLLISEKYDNYEGGHDNDIMKSGFWKPSDMIEMLIWGPYENGIGMNSFIRGAVRVKARGFASWVDINKKLIIDSMGGFKNIKIDSYRFLQPQKGFIDANISWFNPSVVAIDLGTVNFEIFLGDLVIGQAKISSMKIFPGYNHAHISSWLFDRDIFRLNKILLKELISTLTLGGDTPARKEILRLKGTNNSLHGTEIDWLQPSIQLFDKYLPVATNERILTTLETKILLIMAPDGKVKLGKGGSIECKLKLPFESDNFIITVQRVGYSLNLSLPLGGEEFLHIERTVEFNDPSTFSGIHTLNSSLSGSTTNVAREEDILRDDFMSDFIKAEALPIQVNGSMTVDLETPYGETTISGVKFKNYVWQMKGLHGMDGGGKNKVAISKETVTGKIWTIKLQIDNPSDMFMNFGDTEFEVVRKKDSTGCIGVISIEKFSLDYGSNNVTGNFNPAVLRCNSSETAEFLSGFMMGGQNDLILRTISHHKIMGFTGLEIEAQWFSSGYLLFDSIDLVVNEHEMGANIGFKNPFGVILTLDSIDMELVLAKSHKVIATITSHRHTKEITNPGDSIILSTIPLTPVTSAQELIESVQEELLLGEASGSTTITVSGKMRLMISDYEIPTIHFVQENIQAKLVWGR